MMTKVTKEEFQAVLDSIEEYDVGDDTTYGAHLTSYYAFDKRFAQHTQTVDDLHFYLVDWQHVERVRSCQ